VVTHSFSTDPLPESAKFKITFDGETVLTNQVLREQTALVLGIQPSRLINELKTERTLTNSQNKQTEYEWDIPALRNFEGPTPTEEAELEDWQVEELRARIASRDTDAAVPTFNYSTMAFTSYITPAWSSGTLATDSEV